jgi:hypothetical protein
MAEEDSADLQPEVSLRQRIDANGDGTIDTDEKKAFREQYLKRFDRNNDGKLDRNERRHARRRFDRAEDRRDRLEDKFDRREDLRDHREDVRDRREDRWDRKEDVREFKRDRRQYRRHVSRSGGRAQRRQAFPSSPWRASPRQNTAASLPSLKPSAFVLEEKAAWIPGLPFLFNLIRPSRLVFVLKESQEGNLHSPFRGHHRIDSTKKTAREFPRHAPYLLPDCAPDQR